MSAPLEREGGDAAELASCAEVTALRKAEISLVQLRAELAEANGVVQSMAAEISHIVLAHARGDALAVKAVLDDFMARRCTFMTLPPKGMLQ